ncbi:radical SAM protein [Nostoc sp. UHCC 0251]|uniref:radical SAM protein n=1 Tax=Nostoc sp. UHCC 0251 TaxID=3110240 RepID=UPI002B1F7323|nr:radical SAM protein [Nostoc sp. UHCC 0251]MEA5623720.1 radical SAM protein [Nostoc sp. UHCC 0251]
MYTISNNKIDTGRYCEINVVHHCNLSCRGCTHLSPTVPKYIADPEKIYRDLSILSKSYIPRGVKLVGGEPLLHPNIIQVIEAVRASGITKFVKMITNGHLLSKASDLFWEKIDAIEISLYPSKPINPETLKTLKQKAKDSKTILESSYWDDFRESYSELGTENTELVQKIYSTCAVAHVWRCHTVSEGYLYKCPQSVFIPKVIQKENLQNDGIKITDSGDFFEQLLAYLNSEKPLESCSHCLGCVGKRFNHEQVNPKLWRSPQQFTSEELVDLDYLSFVEKQPSKAKGSHREVSLPEKITNITTKLLNNYRK